MRKLFKAAIAVCIVFIIVFATVGCEGSQGDEDSISVVIRLDLNEDIGLLLTEWTVNGQSGMSCTGNADRSMIKRNDILDWSFDRQFLESPADTAEVTLIFTVVTEYFDPNYDFDYPEECKIPMNAVSFTGTFGETYYVSVTGDNVNGYSATLESK
ncbi:MAG: hypothetical protein J5816_01900 [Clostridia bacterium]|nr:hypothetical protein [Clostridia bacterium]MBR5721400.1 hypothetical protein [Clostridia bacterium]